MQTTTGNLTFVAQSWAAQAGQTVAADCDRAGADFLLLRELEEKLLAAEAEAQTSAAVLELVGKLESSENLDQSCFTLVSELKEYLVCQQVALGLRRGGKGRGRLIAVSGMAEFDRRSDFVRSVEATLDESVLRDSQTEWPPSSESQRHASLAHQKLCTQAGVSKLLSLPFRNENGEVTGVLLFLGSERITERPELQRFIRACGSRLGSCLDLIRRAQPSAVARAVQCVVKRRKSWQLKTVVAAALLLGAALAIPMPYKIGCHCQLQPVVRRFVAAPFDATLEKSLVSQGDFVSESQTLATLDGREIRWELAGLTAELNAATKKRDFAMANGNASAAQIAKLDMERLELKIRLLQHRQEHLEINSPLGGIVISGDLEKAQGAPVTIGQTLFEIAPLTKMVVEIAIPEDEISYTREGFEVTVRLEAYPRQSWTAKIERIHPRSEIRENESVYIAELTLDNPEGLLRPGMKGRARIVTASHAIAWNLFHKPIESLALTMGW